jgi:hypothetical protein
MASIVVQIADAVKAQLEAETFSLPVTVKRAYSPSYDLKDMDGVRVTVVPEGNQITNLDRNRFSNAVSVDVAVQRKVASDEPATVDPLMGLMQEVIDCLKANRRLTAFPDCSFMRADAKAIYSPAHVAEKRLFTAVTTFTYMLNQ